MSEREDSPQDVLPRLAQTYSASGTDFQKYSEDPESRAGEAAQLIKRLPEVLRLDLQHSYKMLVWKYIPKVPVLGSPRGGFLELYVYPWPSYMHICARTHTHKF